MGAACTKSNTVVAEEKKGTKKPTTTEPVGRSKTITIGVFGIENAGKTSIIRAIDGAPTEGAQPTTNELTTTITEPFVAPANRKSSSTNNRTTLRLIDVPGTKRARDQTWPQYFEQIHGWIFVVDSSNRKRLRTSQEALDDLYDSDKLRDKPVLFLVTKKDQKGAIEDEDTFRTDFEIERFKQKTRVDLCSALPQKGQDRIDRSLRQGVQWLIRTVEDDFTRLDSRVTKSTKNNKNNRSDSESEDGRKKINTSRLPSIRTKPTTTNRSSKDDSDDDPRSTKPSTTFRASYETFPEETPWSSSKYDDKAPRLTSKSSLNNSTRKRDISPLVHDTKPSTYGSSTKKSDDSDEDDRWKKPTTTSRFDHSTGSSVRKTQSKRFDDDDDEPPRSTSKNHTKRSNYDDDDDAYGSARTKKILPKSRFDHDDDDDDENEYSNSKTRPSHLRSTRDYSD